MLKLSAIWQDLKTALAGPGSAHPSVIDRIESTIKTAEADEAAAASKIEARVAALESGAGAVVGTGNSTLQAFEARIAAIEGWQTKLAEIEGKVNSQADAIGSVNQAVQSTVATVAAHSTTLQTIETAAGDVSALGSRLTAVENAIKGIEGAAAKP